MIAKFLFRRTLTIDFFVTNSYPLKAHDTAFASASFVETEPKTASALGGLTHCYTYCNLYEVLTFGVSSNFLGFFFLVPSSFERTRTTTPRVFCIGLHSVRLYSHLVIIKLGKIDDLYGYFGTELALIFHP